MKKIVVIWMMMLAAISASGQHFGQHDSRHQGPRSGQQYSRHNERDHRSSREWHHGDDRGRHDGRHAEPARGHSGHGRMRSEIRCAHDWQELWNGCHVRVKLDRIYVYNYHDDRILWGDEVILLPSGCYKVRNGNFWHVHARNGDRINNLWGDAIDLMSNGLFRCFRAGRFFYYDERGNERR